MLSPVRLLFLTAFFNALCWIVLIPVWQYPDEQAHFAQVQYIVEKGGIPRDNKDFDTSYEVALSEKILETERDEAGNNKFTYHPEHQLAYNPQTVEKLPKSTRSTFVKNEATLNPPLYYQLAAQVYRLFSFGDLYTRVHAIRIMSSLIFILTVYTAYKMGKLIFQNSYEPLALASLVAFMPMLVFASTGVLPDTLTIFLFSVFTLLCLQIIKTGWITQRIIILCLVVILGALTRQNFLISLFIFPFVVLHQLLFQKKERVKILATILLFFLALIFASFFIRELSFISRLDFPESSGKNPQNALYRLTYFEHLTWTIRHSIAEVWPWYWGVYKWLSLTLPPLVYQIINRLIPLAIIGLVVKLFLAVKRRDFRREMWLFFLIFSIFVYFIALTTFDYFFRKNNGYSFGIQGRYFFPTILTQMALLLTGFSFSKYFVFFLVFGMIIFNDFSLAFVSASYYDTSTLQAFINHTSQFKPTIFWGNILVAIFAITIYLQTLLIFSILNIIQKSK